MTALLERFMTWIVLLFLIVVTAISLASLSSKTNLALPGREELVECTVVKLVTPGVLEVIANETKDVFEEGKTYQVRLIGVKIPEGQEFVALEKELLRFFTERLVGELVFHEVDLQKFDEQGRVLAYLWLEVPKELSHEELNEKLINYALISNGFADFVDPTPNLKYSEYLSDAVRRAKASGLGIWTREETESKKPEEVVRIEIVQVIFKGANEQVVIRNLGNVEVDLKGWRLASLRGRQVYVFPSLVLKPGYSVIVASGPQASGGLIWTKSYVWNDSGDEAVLMDASGKVVSRYVY